MSSLSRYLGRIALRQGWRGYLTSALLLALSGGLAMTSVAGARRTQSSYPRFLRSANASTISLTANGGYDPKIDAAVAALPNVKQARTYVGLETLVMKGDHPDFSLSYEASGTFDGRYFDQDRFKAIEGRRPNPARTDEVAVNSYAARRLGFRLGQRLDLGTFGFDQFGDPGFASHPPAPRLRNQATIVGIGLFPDEVLQDDADRTARLLLTPAFTRQAREFANYSLQGVVLAHGGADIPRLKRDLQGIFPPGTVEFRDTSVDRFHALQAIQPLSIALALFGFIALLAGLVLVSQALSRIVRLERSDRAVFRAIGGSPGTIVAGAALPALAAVVAGTALAIGLAILASPLMPIGPVRRVEVARGFDVDVAVMGWGAVVMILVVSLSVLVVAWREAPHRVAVGRYTRSTTSRLVAAAASSGFSAPAVAGLGLAFESRDDANPIPARTVMVGAAVAVLAVVGSITFGASLDTLLRRPPLYGWSGDATMLFGNGYDHVALSRVRAVLDVDKSVAAWSGAYFGADAIDGIDVPLIGMQPRSRVGIPLLQGRSIRNADEIVLGSATATRLNKKIGDEVTLAGGDHPVILQVVGLATFPTVGTIHLAHTSLGVGALVAPVHVPGSNMDMTRQHVGDFGPNAIFVRYGRGTNRGRELAHLRHTTAPLAGFAGLDVLPVQRPAEIVNSGSIGKAPVLLASVLALGAAISLALALATSVRYRRYDLALLKTFGFTRRQVAATVAWHATTTTAVGLAAGLPLGLVVGPRLWALFAHRLNVVPRSSVPLVGLMAVVAVSLAVANAAAAVPARMARRIDPSRLLRSEGGG